MGRLTGYSYQYICDLECGRARITAHMIEQYRRIKTGVEPEPRPKIAPKPR
jgi:hypothetical protein